jgi:hypothetical protein
MVAQPIIRRYKVWAGFNGVRKFSFWVVHILKPAVIPFQAFDNISRHFFISAASRETDEQDYQK